MTTNVNDIKAIETKFVNNMGSGRAAAVHLVTLVREAIKSNDGRHIASAIARLGSKGDKQGATAVRGIVGTVFVDSKIRTAKDKKTIVLDLSKAQFNDEAMQRLVDGVSDNLSIRDTLVKRVKGEATKKELVLTDYASKLVKRMNGQGVTKAALIAAIQAA